MRREVLKLNTTVTYQCPNCSAGLLFDAEKQKFCCEFCLSEFDESELKETDSAQRAEETFKNADDFCNHMNEYQCPNCGAEIVSDENTAADFCYYCHNPIVLVGKLSGQMRPDKIIPFKYDKKQAEEMFLKNAKKKWFLPKGFIEPGQVDKISGVYFPFWVTDADTRCSADAMATRVRTWVSGDYQYTETSRFKLRRDGDIHFEDIVTSALSDADKAMLEGVLPYPSDSLMDFSLPYLSGFTAKKRDIEREKLTAEVRGRMNGYADTLLRRTMDGYSTVNVLQENVHILKSHWEYSLMPIWILTYKDKKRVYTYAMNGYTGKIYGEYPFSIGKILAFAGTVAAVAGSCIALLGGAFIC